MSNKTHKALRWYAKLFGRTVTHQDKRDMNQDVEFENKLLHDWRQSRGKHNEKTAS